MLKMILVGNNLERSKAELEPMNHLSGQKFGNAMVLDFLKRDFTGRDMWKIVCDCGNTDMVSTQEWMSQKVVDCGCGMGSGIDTENQRKEMETV